MSARSTASQSNFPQHIGIIMDGNRRWARKQGFGVLNGHNYVVDHVIEPLVDRCIELHIPYLTLWAFSTENWQRDQEEVQGLMHIFRRAFHKKVEDLHKKGVKLRAIGDLSRFPEDIQKGIRDWEEKGKNNDKITVSFALNYGGRDEILRAVNCVVKETEKKSDGEKIAEQKITGQQITEQRITEQQLAAHLDTMGMPDPDLIIRPGGEKRLSGFLAWQAVYAELYFTDVLMPEFTPEKLDEAIKEYQHRNRRFGK